MASRSSSCRPSNEPELAELPEELRRDMKFVPVATLEQALKVSLPQEAPAS